MALWYVIAEFRKPHLASHIPATHRIVFPRMKVQRGLMLISRGLRFAQSNNSSKPVLILGRNALSNTFDFAHNTRDSINEIGDGIRSPSRDVAQDYSTRSKER